MFEEGQEERICGYEELDVTICLSSKRLIPLVQITYKKKAPIFAKIDDVEAMLRKHYGQIYTDRDTFEREVLAKERNQIKTREDLPGANFSELGDKWLI